jgi:hypothetical protein
MFVRAVACSLVAVGSLSAQGRGQRPVVVDPGASIDIVVKPVRNGASDVQYAEVREHIVRSAGVTNAEFAVRVPSGPPGAPPAGLEIVEMTDANGAVPVRADSGSRLVRATRPVTFPVTLVFKARMWPPGTRTNPSFMLRSSEGGVSGQGTGMFVVPDDGVDYAGHFRWDLSELASGALTTSGITDDNDVRAPLSALLNTFFMAGALHRYPASGDRDGFVAYWHGTPTWDGPAAMGWVASMYEYMRKFWGETTPRRYRVMGRMFAPPAYGGTALPNHFIFNAPSGPRDTSDPGPLLLLAHETGHLFVRGLQNPGGGGPSNNWFSEGLNEYYAVMLALRSGLAPLPLVLQQMNVQTRNYFTNPRRYLPADSIALANPFIDGRAQNVSYERGLLFWADMDSRIRAATNNRRTLDSVIVPLVTRARKIGGAGTVDNGARPGGQPGWFTPNELLDSLVKAAGPSARAVYDSVIVRGRPFVPASNAFGPCFDLKQVKIPDSYAGSPGTRAPGAPGIDTTAPIITAYIWERVASVPDTRCRKW